MTLLHLMHKRLIAEIMLLALFLAGCSPAVEARPLGGGGATSTPTQVQTATPEALPAAHSPLAAPTQPPSPLVPDNPQWRIHTDPTGLVSFEYPADWQVKLLWVGGPLPPQRTAEEILMVHRPFAPSTGDSGGEEWAFSGNQIQVTITHTPRENFDQYLPEAFVPNERGYEAYFTTPLAVPNGSGLLFIWGDEGLWEGGGGECPACLVLVARFFSDVDDLTMQMWFHPSPELALQAEQIGLEAAIAQHQPVFDHMVRSLRFLTP